MLTKEEWLQALADREGWPRLKKFQQGRVLICGLGGLGSRVAELLTRAGVGQLRLVDFDVLEATNLNRQLYGMEQLGQYKAKALEENLRWITPYVDLDVRVDKVTEGNLPDLVRDVDVVVEAFDNPAAKALLVNFIREQYPALPLVAASGMAGFGSGNDVQVRQLSRNFYLCGDRVTGLDKGDGLYGARVALCASQQALVVLQILAKSKE